MWTEKLSNVVLVHGYKRYAVCEPYRRTHTQTKFSTEHTSVGLAHARPKTAGKPGAYSCSLHGTRSCQLVFSIIPVYLSLAERLYGQC